MSSKDQGQEGKPKVAESTKECFAHIMQIDSLLTSQHISSHQGNWNPKQNLKWLLNPTQQITSWTLPTSEKGSATGVLTGQKSEPDPKKKKKKKNQIDLILPWLDLKIWVPTENKQVNEERVRERERERERLLLCSRISQYPTRSWTSYAPLNDHKLVKNKTERKIRRRRRRSRAFSTSVKHCLDFSFAFSSPLPWVFDFWCGGRLVSEGQITFSAMFKAFFILARIWPV